MDRIDRKIVALLQDDATLSLAQIAHRVGLSQTPCWKRIRRLEAGGVIIRRVAVVAPEAVGLDLTAIVTVQTSDHSKAGLELFAETVSRMPEVMEFYRMAGEIDYVLKVAVANVAAYDAFYKRLIETLPLKTVTSHIAVERIKASTAYPIDIDTLRDKVA